MSSFRDLIPNDLIVQLSAIFPIFPHSYAFLSNITSENATDHQCLLLVQTPHSSLDHGNPFLAGTEALSPRLPRQGY
jgi:hypothetical protein